MEVEAINDIGASVGDTVVIGFKTAPLMKLSFLLYVFPILFLIIGAFIGQSLAPRFQMNASTLSVMCAFIFFIMATIIIRIIGKWLSTEDSYRAKIIRISSRAPKNNSSFSSNERNEKNNQ